MVALPDLPVVLPGHSWLELGLDVGFELVEGGLGVLGGQLGALDALADAAELADCGCSRREDGPIVLIFGTAPGATTLS